MSLTFTTVGGPLPGLAKLVAAVLLFGATLGRAVAVELLAPTPTPAPALPFWPLPEGGLIITFGLGPEVINSFPGAKTYSVLPLPWLDWHKSGEIEAFHTPDDGFGLSLLDLGQLKAGPVARYVPERGTGNGNFAGLPSVPWIAEVGGFVEYWPADFLRGISNCGKASTVMSVLMAI
jgi:MipA family protein